jgi:hypothetical protein
LGHRGVRSAEAVRQPVPRREGEMKLNSISGTTGYVEDLEPNALPGDA